MSNCAKTALGCCNLFHTQQTHIQGTLFCCLLLKKIINKIKSLNCTAKGNIFARQQRAASIVEEMGTVLANEAGLSSSAEKLQPGEWGAGIDYTLLQTFTNAGTNSLGQVMTLSFCDAYQTNHDLKSSIRSRPKGSTSDIQLGKSNYFLQKAP